MSKNRNIVIDSTVVGMGQGAGNLQTELIVYHLMVNMNKRYIMNGILNCVDIVEKFMSSSLWGYSVMNLLPAIYKTAYKYSAEFKNKYKMKYSDIDLLFSTMPEKYRNRYTPENAEEIYLKYIKGRNK